MAIGSWSKDADIRNDRGSPEREAVDHSYEQDVHKSDKKDNWDDKVKTVPFIPAIQGSGFFSGFCHV
jgi:hypothetical protein